MTRLIAHAHYLSDVTFGALLGWAVGWGVWMEWGFNDRKPRTEDRKQPEAGRPEAG